MRVVLWNILAGGGARVPRVAGALLGWRPELVILCEFRATAPSRQLADRLAAAGLGHQRTTAAPARARENALLVASRWPLRRITPAAVPVAPRRWLAVSVRAPRPFLLGAMHVPNRETGHKYDFHDQALAVARRWKRRRALLIGDTNTGLPGLDEQAPAFTCHEKRWLDGLAALGFRDTFRHLHGDRRAYTWYSPNGRNGFRLDQAFVSPALLGLVGGTAYRWVGGRERGASDHAALLLDLVG